MMPASKHGDPQLGIDIHLHIPVPPTPPQIPLPTCHISVVFDPFDYCPFIGGTIEVHGMKRTTAGTNGIAVHIPSGFPFAPKWPEMTDELFMGSNSVVADGDPFTYLALPVLSCQVVGMPPPPRPRKPDIPNALCLPTVVNLAIPNTVFVGGGPTISLLGMAFKGLFAGLGKFARSGLFKKMRQKVFGEMKPGFLKCVILRAEPVNIMTGEVSVEHEDFSLPGRMPIQWQRKYSSANLRLNSLGYGWETIADTRLEIDTNNSIATFVHPNEGPAVFPELPTQRGDAGAVLELVDGALLSDHGDEFRVRTKEDHIFHFPKPLGRAGEGGVTEYPIGRIADLCDNWLEFKRRGTRLLSINESAGRRIEVGMEGGLIRSLALHIPDTDQRHEFVRYEYDEDKNLVAAIDALGNARRFVYDQHHMVQHTDRVGLSFYYEYDKAHPDGWRVVHSWGDGNLYNYHFEYIDALNERRITNSLGHVSIVKLADETGLPISEIDALGGKTSYEYDEVGRTTAVVDQDGHRTQYDYDERGNLIKLTRADGTSIRTEFDGVNKPVKVVDPNGNTWMQKWDERGLLSRQKTPLEHVSAYEYDQHGQLNAYVNARGVRTQFGYDGIGNLTLIKNALGRVTAFVYDALGNLVAKRDPLKRETHYSYDRKGRLIRFALSSGANVHCEYDGEDQLSRYSDENGAITTFEYYGIGQIAKRTQPDGNGVAYLYDTEEQIIAVINQRDERYHIVRDAMGRIIEEVDYWSQSRRYEYSAAGVIRHSIDPLGRRVSFTTDAVGRIVQKTLVDWLHSGQQVKESFRYDKAGQLIEARNSASLLVRAFNAEGWPIEERQNDFKIENQYDEVGNRTLRKTSIGSTVAIEYDPLNQPAKIFIDREEPIVVERNALGQATHEQLTAHLTRTFEYNDDGLISTQALHCDNSPQFETRYQYDKTGNLVYRSDSKRGSDRYIYDPMGRVLKHIDPTGTMRQYLNDPAGDRLRTRVSEMESKRAVGGDPSMVAWSRDGVCDGVHYSFDRAGNLTSRTRTTPDGENHLDLEWDANQQLVRTASRRNKSEQQVTTYGYDPLGRRVFKRNAAHTTWFYWDGDRLAAEVGEDGLGSGSVTSAVVELSAPPARPRPTHSNLREYVYWPHSFQPLALVIGEDCLKRQSPTSAPSAVSTPSSRMVLWYHNDPNGAPTKLLDTKGRELWSASYGAFGETLDLHDKLIEQALRLQGQREDQETGLRYNRYRYFDPAIGLFVSQDPLGQLAGTNLYAYGWNSFKSVDPLGLMPWKNPVNVGHHLVPQHLARSTGATDVARLLGTNMDTPTFFFKEPYEVGAHEMIHRAQAPHVGRLQGVWSGTADELVEASGRGLKDVDSIVGDLKIPSTGEVLARDVTPSQAFEKLKEWFKKASRGCA